MGVKVFLRAWAALGSGGPSVGARWALEVWEISGCLAGSAFWRADLSLALDATAFCEYAAASSVAAAAFWGIASAFSGSAASFWGSAMVAEGVKDVAVGLTDDAGVEKAIARQGGTDSGAA